MIKQLLKTKSERQERLADLLMKRDLLADSHEMQLLTAFRRLPEEKQKAIEHDWKEYFLDCRQSAAALNFFEMKKAFEEHNMQEVRERAAWAREMRLSEPTIKKPTSFPNDPDSLLTHFKVVAFYAVQREINEMTFYAKDAAKASTDL